MLSKKSMKILSIIVMVVMLLITIGNVAFAAGIKVPDPSNPDTTEFDNTIGMVLGVIRYGGIIAAVIIAMIIGIKYSF